MTFVLRAVSELQKGRVTPLVAVQVVPSPVVDPAFVWAARLQYPPPKDDEPAADPHQHGRAAGDVRGEGRALRLEAPPPSVSAGE